ncbi:MAG TPA: hypothetical protein VHB74_11760 [Devosia sp.]|nr:hypothetical protein [Devosia sp.]
MNRLSILAAAGLLGLGLAGGVTPSFAESIASCQSTAVNSYAGDTHSPINDQSGTFAAALKEKGIQATNVQDWGGCVKADVVEKNGHVAQEFFDPATLQRLTVNG